MVDSVIGHDVLPKQQNWMLKHADSHAIKNGTAF
jgi:hypothetical protein